MCLSSVYETRLGYWWYPPCTAQKYQTRDALHRGREGLAFLADHEDESFSWSRGCHATTQHAP